MTTEIDALIRELQAVTADAISCHDEDRLFASFVENFATAVRSQDAVPVTQPVVDQYLTVAVANAPEPWRRLAHLLLHASPHLPWLRSYENLESSPELEMFRAHYSYQLIAGPVFRGHQPPAFAPDLLVGFSLQAPNVFYPQHHHEPAEMYGVISGHLDWQVGDTWSRVGPGDVIVHRSHESHAMRTFDEPALTWVLWPTDPDCNVYMPSMDPADETMEPRRYS